jgi:hypothetical protein
MDSWIKCQDKLPTVVEALARFLGLLASSIPWPVALCSTVTLSAAQKMQKCFLSWYNPFENSPEDSHFAWLHERFAKDVDVVTTQAMSS